MSASGFRGTSVEQDGRWGKAEEKLLNEMAKKGKFAAILDTKVSMKKVNVDVISKWVSQKIIQLLKVEDEVLINMVINILQGGSDLDGKKIQVLLTPFLNKDTPRFMEELWTHLTDAQTQSNGIPASFIEQKKQEIQARSIQNEIRTQRPMLDRPAQAVSAAPTRSGSPPGRITSGMRVNTSPPSLRSLRAPDEDRSKRAESRSARIHRPREQAPIEHREDEMDRQRARSRRHGLDERSQSTKKRPLEEEEDKPRQRYPSRHRGESRREDKRDRPEAVRVRRSPPRDI